MAKKIRLSRKQAVKDYCKECCGYQANMVRKCTDYSCHLYPFRLGTPDTKNYVQTTARDRQKGI